MSRGRHACFVEEAPAAGSGFPDEHVPPGGSDRSSTPPKRRAPGGPRPEVSRPTLQELDWLRPGKALMGISTSPRRTGEARGFSSRRDLGPSPTSRSSSPTGRCRSFKAQPDRWTKARADRGPPPSERFRRHGRLLGGVPGVPRPRSSWSAPASRARPRTSLSSVWDPTFTVLDRDLFPSSGARRDPLRELVTGRRPPVPRGPCGRVRGRRRRRRHGAG